MRWDIWGAIMGAICAISGLVIIVHKIDPFQASFFIKALFYFTLFLSLFGVFILVSYSARRAFAVNFIHERIALLSFRQGLIAALVIMFFLIFRKIFY